MPMKTVGQILRSARETKYFSVEQIAALTKIDAEYITAIESDDYSRLPSETFAKGFIRNLSLRLDKNPDEMVAVFRRDFRHPQTEKPKTTRRLKPFSFLNPQFYLVALASIVFLVYLAFQ